MSYNFGDISEVESNVDEFLRDNNFSSQSRLITAFPAHKNKFLILDDNLIKSLNGRNLVERSVDADGVITNLINVPVCFKPADCAVVGFEFSPLERGDSDLSESGCVDNTFRLAEGEPHFNKLSTSPSFLGRKEDVFFGLLHIGLDDYLNDIVSKFNDFIVGTTLTSRASVTRLSLQINKIQVFPFLQKYRIDYKDFHSDKYDWNSIEKIQEYIECDEKGRFVDFHKAVYNELVKVFGESFVNFTNVRDTFELAKEGKAFSHSLSNFHSEFENGRNVVVGEII